MICSKVNSSRSRSKGANKNLWPPELAERATTSIYNTPSAYSALGEFNHNHR